MQHIKIEKWFLPLLILFVCLLILLVPMFRFLHGNPLYVAGEHYVFLDATTNTSYLDMSEYLFSNVLTNANLLAYIFPLILLLFSIILFSNLVKHYAKTPTEYYLSLIIFVTTPMFILTYLSLTKISLFMFFALFSIYSYHKLEKVVFFAHFLMALFFPHMALFFLIPAAIFKHKDKWVLLNFLLATGLALTISYFIPLSRNGFKFAMPVLTNILTFFGASYGYSIIVIFFGVMGMFMELNKKKHNKYLGLLMLFFILSFFNIYFRIVMLIPLAIFAARYVTKLISSKAKQNTLKYATLLLIACIIFFSLSTAIQDSVNESPSKDHVKALDYLKNVKYSYGEGKVLSNKDYASFIKYYSGLEPFNNGDSDKETSSDEIFYSRKYAFISDAMDKHNIDYILIDSKMTSGDVWPNTREDLLFVLEHSSHFKEIYRENGVKIYYLQVLLEE